MLLLLRSDVFRSAEASETVFQLLVCYSRGRCYMSVEEIEDLDYQLWLAALDPQFRTIWDSALERTTLDSATRRLPTVLVTTAGSMEVHSSATQVDLKDAFSLVVSSRRIWIENGRSDRDFWLSALDGNTRDYILRLESQGIIEFEHTGGIGEARKLLAQKSYRIGFAYLNWLLFDSDSFVPGELGAEAKRLAEDCSREGVGFHCLRRRAIENYLPKAALYVRANRMKPKAAALERRKLEALFSLPDAQRHGFPMKNGLGRLAPDLIAQYYPGLSEEKRNMLAHGFGDRLSDLFHEGSYDWIFSEMTKEGSIVELQFAFSRIVERFRVPHG